MWICTNMTLLKFSNSEKNAIFRGRVELHIQILKVPDFFFFFFFFHIFNKMGLMIFSRKYLRSKQWLPTISNLLKSPWKLMTVAKKSAINKVALWRNYEIYAFLRIFTQIYVFTHSSSLFIILFNVGLCRSAFSAIWFGELGFVISMFPAFFALNKMFWTKTLKYRLLKKC